MGLPPTDRGSRPRRPLRLALAVAAAWLAGACQVQSYVTARGHRSASAPRDPVAAPSAPFTVVTFNVWRSADVDAAIEAMTSHPDLRDAAIVLLQEMEPAGARRMADALRMHHVYYPSWSQDGRRSGAAILSRFPIRSDRAILLPHPSPLDGRRRRAVRAIVETPEGPLLVYAVHLVPAWMSVRGRRAQARHILDDASQSALPAIIGGDFNTLEPWSVRRVVDDYRILGFDWATRDVEATADYFFGSPRLDHIFVRGLAPLAAGAPRTEASDHRPVWTRVRLEQR